MLTPQTDCLIKSIATIQRVYHTCAVAPWDQVYQQVYVRLNHTLVEDVITLIQGDFRRMWGVRSWVLPRTG